MAATATVRCAYRKGIGLGDRPQLLRLSGDLQLATTSDR